MKGRDPRHCSRSLSSQGAHLHTRPSTPFDAWRNLRSAVVTRRGCAGAYLSAGGTHLFGIKYRVLQRWRLIIARYTSSRSKFISFTNPHYTPVKFRICLDFRISNRSSINLLFQGVSNSRSCRTTAHVARWDPRNPHGLALVSWDESILLRVCRS